MWSRPARTKTTSHLVLVLAILTGWATGASAAVDQYGQVMFGGLPVPGVTVSASQQDRQLVTSTDQNGVYKLILADGVWTIRVEMLGFTTLTREVTIGNDSPPLTWELTLRPFEEIARAQGSRQGEDSLSKSQPPFPELLNGNAKAPDVAPSVRERDGFMRSDVARAATASDATDIRASAAANDESSTAAGMDATDGFVINGSVNNGAASPFAQPAAFGNNRRRPGALYNFALGVQADTSAWDARPFSFSGVQATKDRYNDVHVIGTFGGPIKIPRVLNNGPNFFFGFQHTADHNATTQHALMPTSLERAGDFSQTRDREGRAIQIVDPVTGRTFPGNVIPRERISPQASAFLDYYPRPNLDVPGGYNYQAPVVTAARQDSLQARLSQPLNSRNQLFGTISYQRTTTDTTTLFGFEDAAEVSAVDTQANWSHRFSQTLFLRLRYQLTGTTNHMTPYFANRINVSGDADIQGNDQEPVNWGPPSLGFSSGVAPLGDAQYRFTRDRIHGPGAEAYWSRGRHGFTFGGDVRTIHFDIFSQQDPRGTFAFTGAATGSDLADFLLGTPTTSSIAFGNADKYLRSRSYDAYVADDWRLGPGLTINVGVRWEYEAPITELYGRLVNLDITSGFYNVSPVVASAPAGPLTGRSYPDSLLLPDRLGIQPRGAIAWRPIAGSSLVIRAGYGVYRNTNIYQPIATLLAQQPPLSKTFSVQNDAAHPLTLADGFSASPAIGNTFAVDPNLRVGYAQNWQISAQRDLPASSTIIATYLGTKGSRLLQEFLPNTYPTGAADPCSSCPSGFIYLTSNGSSSRHAGQVQLRRRLRNGLTASVQYTLSNAVDDATAFAAVSVNGSSIAQNWLDLDAERGPSTFDQRHVMTAQVQYTTGVGVRGGTLLSGFHGSLVKGWTVLGQLTSGSGLPFTPVYLNPVTGTGVVGTLRPDLTGAPVDAAPEGAYVNPGAYAAPAPGHWGNASRNSARGPAQFSLNAGIRRSFPWGDRLNLDWGIDATNVLNRVTYAGVNPVVGSPQFGLPNVANPMRKLQMSLRLRY
ncbi:MAG: TonB-dependent receptor [Blastocatellia bacterium]|nr:MAG: TonB-dependent receptor [Blastocatellia bacterium]